ncbi:hypothetical protein [Endozoicomonas acroporae]|uniref:hypothetical protein n=1 Tax=Endozoicomonas acroporae TaxID=1701104 RepID=UPI003D78D01A
MTVLNMADLADQVIEETEALRRQVFVADGHITINVSYEYNIALSSCDTAEKLLHKVWHLCEKTWITPEVLRYFIRLACRENGIKLQG